MLDYGALPPEINSGRMYAGPGSAPLMAAATAWDTLAAGLDSVSRDYSSVITRLQGESWSGGASVAMAAAAAPFVAWMMNAGAQAEEAAIQARLAAGAYETAFGATVPPQVVAANRSQLAALVATNVLGQNTSAIATTEVAYDQMWAQDATAMYGYAARSSVASRLTPFDDPPQIANPAGQSDQAATVAQAVATSTAGHGTTTLSRMTSAVPQQLQTLASAGGTNSTAVSTAAADPSSSLLTAFSDFNTLTAPINLGDGISRTYTSGGSMFYAAKRDVEAHPPAPGPTPTSQIVGGGPPIFEPGPASVRGPVLASLGGAAPIGGLSVPHSWAAATPIASAGADPQWLSETDLASVSSQQGSPATNVFSGLSPAGAGTRSGGFSGPTVNNVLRVTPRQFKMPRPSLGG